jgi:TPR repeat protein
MVIYSASRGQQALDRLNEKDTNPNSVFTREFIARMRKPGVKVDDLMREVQEAVETLASSVSHEQRPAIYNESRGNFYFFGPTKIQISDSGGLSLSEDQKDEKYWQEVNVISNRDAYEAYLQRYPRGLYASLAKAYLEKLLDGGVIVGTSGKPLPPTATIELKELYKKAIKENDASAQATLGQSYQFGWSGLEKDDFEASRLFRLSADQGNPRGQACLGHFYREGRGGLTQNFSEALRLTLLSAKNGDSMAQEHLGWLFSAGLAGAPKDDLQALYWTRLSAAQGEWNAENRLGIFYRDARGGLQTNVIEAVKWFKLASDKGHPDARLNLAKFYEEGIGGLPKDKDEAIRLYQLVARGTTNPEAGKKALQRLGAK